MSPKQETFMELVNSEIRAKLLYNGHKSSEASEADDNFDPYPVVKLFTPDSKVTWLLTELAPNDKDLAFGLCDWGVGNPEIGSVRLSDIARVKGHLGLSVERDTLFKAKMTLNQYAEEARRQQILVA
jgi:hypothetical protein